MRMLLNWPHLWAVKSSRRTIPKTRVWHCSLNSFQRGLKIVQPVPREVRAEGGCGCWFFFWFFSFLFFFFIFCYIFKRYKLQGQDSIFFTLGTHRPLGTLHGAHTMAVTRPGNWSCFILQMWRFSEGPDRGFPILSEAWEVGLLPSAPTIPLWFLPLLITQRWLHISMGAVWVITAV